VNPGGPVTPGGAPNGFDWPDPDRPSSILLVDDDSTTILVLSRILAELGRLRYATNGVEALRLAR
jgi:PleD family two-component response regulator